MLLAAATLVVGGALAGIRAPHPTHTLELSVVPRAVEEMALAQAVAPFAPPRPAIGGGPRPRWYTREIAPPWIEPGEALRLTLDQIDRRAGLGPGGAVVSALRDRVQAADVVGSATFHVGVDAGGRVRVVRVHDVADPARLPAWLALGEALAEGPPVSLRAPPSWASAAWITIRVNARERMTSGDLPGHDIRQDQSGISFDVADLAGSAGRVVRTEITGEEWR